MTTDGDDSSRRDQSAAEQNPDAVNETARATKGKKAAHSNTAAAAQAAAAAHAAASDARHPQSAPVTRELVSPDDEPEAGAGFSGPYDEDEVDEGATREAPAVAPLAASDDPDATIMRSQPRPVLADAEGMDEPMTEPSPQRPHYNTLASTFNRPRSAASDPGSPSGRLTPPEPALSAPQAPQTPFTPQMSAPTEPDAFEGFVDEVDDSEDEWALADQPTVQWTPEQITQMQRLKPDFLQTGEQLSWPPRPGSAPVAPEADASHHDWRAGLPPRPRPPFPMNGAPRPLPSEPRLAGPDGRVAPEAASASVAGAAPDPRMERFQELRRQRFAHDQGDRATGDPAPMGAAVRQWWSDLRPGLQSALHYQREARASGMHPIPAYENATTSRLGDAFGRLAASARELTERAQQAAAPTIKRIHDQVEQAAQGIISRFEGDTVRQQAPLLGPGRIAIFFRQGVSVGQAQRLLAASAARPMRLIPRKHGFLARVQPGKEAEVCERLRGHPYVSDVVYLEFNEYGEPVGGRR
ncbi:MAG TPA: hypothetical protein VIG77_11265 [Ktedonobacterales bacterium]|jgi:hypothetical protein